MTETTGEAVRRPLVPQAAPPDASDAERPVDRFPGGGELGALIRAKDWSTTPLGPMAHWPQSLRTAVSMVLYSDFPMIVLWGPELVQIYNDAYRLLMGVKHPDGLGQGNRECWPEAWHINETIYPRVFAGETVSFRETPYPLAPYGVVEDYYLTLSYSPVHDERGGGRRRVRHGVRRHRPRCGRAPSGTTRWREARAERERLYDVFAQAPAAIAVRGGRRLPVHRRQRALPRAGRRTRRRGAHAARGAARGRGAGLPRRCSTACARPASR